MHPSGPKCTKKGFFLKKLLLYLFGVTIIAIWGSANAHAQAWLDPGWKYRSGVTISNPGASALTDYQVHITLDSSFDFANAKADGSDIRVTTADGVTLIPFWIETWIPSTQQGSIWVRVPSIPDGGTNLFPYYGNPNPPEPQVTPTEGPPTGPFIRASRNPIRPIGDPANGNGLLAENIVYDNVTGHYWMVFKGVQGVGLVWSDNPTDPASWHWYGFVYAGNAGGSYGPHLLKYNGIWYLFFSDWSGAL